MTANWQPVYAALAALRQKIHEIDFLAAVTNDVPAWEQELATQEPTDPALEEIFQQRDDAIGEVHALQRLVAALCVENQRLRGGGL